MNNLSRRQFLALAAALGAGAAIPLDLSAGSMPSNMRLGLVTYLWGKDWDLPTLIKNCQATGYEGIELRCEHAHKVELDLTPAQRKEVRTRFEESGIVCVGYGSNFEYHSSDPNILKWNIEQTKEYIKLYKELGATGVRVKPNGYTKGVEREKTHAQIGAALNEVGRFAKEYDMAIRVEVHGEGTQELPNMKAIFEHVTENSVKMCWNCNEQDLLPPGIEYNFNLVKHWLGDTTHIRELDDPKYPYQQLFSMLKKANYNGWVLLEARTNPSDRVVAMKEQKAIFERMIRNA